MPVATAGNAPGTSPTEPSRPTAVVTLVRTDPRDAQQRQVVARIDGGPQTTLVFGDRQTIEVAPGSHVLRVNNTLIWKRVPFAVEAGDHLEFQLINRPGRVTLGFLALLGVAPLFLEVESSKVT